MSFNAKDAEKRALDRIACHPADSGSCWRCKDARHLLSALSLLKEAGEALEKLAAFAEPIGPVSDKIMSEADSILAKLRAAGVLKEDR